jgi:7-carboxy-7-deazaguanine synthase (Cx14CxxC type)
VFLRFAGCNLWSGREAHRAGAVCRFCDTDFVGTDGSGGGKFESAEELAAAVVAKWPRPTRSGPGYVVCTGGEPLLQMDSNAIEALHNAGFEIAVETNGTIAAPEGLDWICVSPKANAPLRQTSGNELKLVYPQREVAAQPEQFRHLQFAHFFLQPLDDEDRVQNTEAAIRYCLENPAWKLSLQTHKYIGIP